MLAAAYQRARITMPRNRALDLGQELVDNQYTSGSNSAVEFLPSKQAVAGSNPVSRSSLCRGFVVPIPMYRINRDVGFLRV